MTTTNGIHLSLQENIGGASRPLSGNEMNKIKGALATIKILGDRYPAQLQAKIGK